MTFPYFSISDIAGGNIKQIGNSRVDKVMQGVFQIATWDLWKERNRMVNADVDSR